MKFRGIYYTEYSYKYKYVFLVCVFNAHVIHLQNFWFIKAKKSGKYNLYLIKCNICNFSEYRAIKNLSLVSNKTEND